jgi:hypothetical protein
VRKAVIDPARKDDPRGMIVVGLVMAGLLLAGYLKVRAEERRNLRPVDTVSAGL